MKSEIFSIKGAFRNLCIAFFLCQCPSASFAETDSVAAPQMILRSVLVNTEEKRFDSALVCRSYQNNFQFSYEGLDLSFSPGLMYRYRIQPDKTWKTTIERTLVFPALPAGQYRFEVETKNERSRWSAPIQFHFEIVPPLYARWWFIILIATLLTAGIVFIVYRRNMIFLRKSKEEMMRQQRMNEMENQAKHAMMNPHFIFNALNSIQLYMNANDRVAANKYLTKFSRLIRLNLELVNKNLVSLEEELEKLRLYLELEQLRFGSKLNYEISADEKLETDIILIPSMILQPFVENAIWHGLMRTESGGRIVINIYSTDGDRVLCLEVIDDGIGINRSRQLNKTMIRKSFGTQLTIDRLIIFGKQHGGTANVLFHDLSQDESDAHGTKVEIRIPLVFDHV